MSSPGGPAGAIGRRRSRRRRRAVARLAHISDLHFGASDEKAIETLGAAIEDAAPDAIIVTGDVTQSGRRAEFEDAAAFFRRLKPPLMIVPGNHDAPVYSVWLRLADPWRRFRRILNSETGAVLDIAGARIIGLNSARRARASLDWSRGRLSRKQIADAALAARNADETTLRFIALHHPMRRSPGRAGEAVVDRAGEAMHAFGDAGVDAILTGHVHISNVAAHGDSQNALIIVAAGTASSTRLRGETPSFNLIEGDRRNLAVIIFAFEHGRYDTKDRRVFLNGGQGWQAVSP